MTCQGNSLFLALIQSLLLTVEKTIQGGARDPQEFSRPAFVAAGLLYGQGNFLFPEFWLSRSFQGKPGKYQREMLGFDSLSGALDQSILQDVL